MKAPARFVTDTTLPTRLMAHLNSVAQARFPYDQERGLVALQEALRTLDSSAVEHARDLAPMGSTPVSSSLTLGATIKLVLITAVGLTVFGAWSGWRAMQSQTSTLPSSRSVSTVAPAPALSSPPLPAAQVPPPPSIEGSAAAPRQGNTTKSSARFAQSPETSRARREVAQLNAAKRSLPADPATALRLARHSNREFPQGLLREERDALIVIALSQLGEVAAARSGAEQFLSRYPRSSFRARMQECVLP